MSHDGFDASRGAGNDPAPFIVTLAFDSAGADHFEAMRRTHFPAHRNHIPAHLTLFHKLPGEDEAEIARILREATREAEPFALKVTGLRFLGYGCAYEIEAPELSSLRRDLAGRFASWLTPQDRQGYRPHVTIQNKAPSGEAKALFSTMSAQFEPFEAGARGLLLWRYRGGPWDAAGMFPFAGS